MTKLALAAFLAAAVLAIAAAPDANAAQPDTTSPGAKVFAANCAGCHGANAAGVPGTFPPLTANPYVAGDPKRVIHTVKYGLRGKIVVKGAQYDGVMPPWTGTLSDTQLAAVISYVRTTWGNHGSRVSAAQVKAVTK